jgi:hypothetical protein
MRILRFTAVATLLSANAFAAATAWHVEPLPDSAPLYQQSGCMGSFSPKGNTSQTVFIDDSADVNSKANIKLGGKLFVLSLISSKVNGKVGGDSSGPGTHFDRMFKDKAGAVSVTAALVSGKEHPDADSTEMAGTLSVTYKGTTQKIAIQGGVAC